MHMKLISMSDRIRSLPKSTTSFGINCLGLVSYFFASAFFFLNDARITTNEIGLIMIAAAIPSLIHTWLLCGKHATPIRPDEPRKVTVQRVITKCVGLAGTFIAIALLYWLFPEYHKPFFLPFWNLVLHAAPWLLITSPFYIYFTDKRMLNPEDGLWHMGQWFLARYTLVNYALMYEHIRAWLIKAFFLPLMTIYLSYNSNELMHITLTEWNVTTIYTHANTLLFTIDLVFAATGYVMTLRLFDTHIRSSEPTLLGWIVCLLCYSPFWEQLAEPSYLAYDDHISWLSFIDQFPLLSYFWCFLIIACLSIYALSTIAFGIRFSNLTYRGLITNGTYRYSKHPAYIAKNLSWWLIAIPFVAENSDIASAIRNCTLLIGVNLLYFLRARTEEKHLSRYPEYIAYAEWINEHGVLRNLGTIIPYLRYTLPSNNTSAPHVK